MNDKFSFFSLGHVLFASLTMLLAAVAQGDELSRISCEEFSSKFGSRDHTKLQKEAWFKEWKGQSVVWTGTVTQVQDGFLSGKTVSIKCLPDTLVADVIAYFGRGDHPELLNLRVGQKIAIEGTIETWGEVLPHTLANAKIW